MKKAGDIISDLFKTSFGEDFFNSAKSSAELFNSWDRIVFEAWYPGAVPAADQQNPDAAQEIPAAAAHSRISDLKRGVLLIEADHPGWVQILQTKKADLLEVVKRRCPSMDIRNISFILNRDRSG